MVTKSYMHRKGLSKKETKLLTRLSSKQKKIIKIKDIEEELNTTYDHAKKMASKLQKKGWLERLERGKYLIVPLEAGEKSDYTEHEFIIASNLVPAYYIAFLSALNFHGMTEQTPFTVFVATKVRKKNKSIHGIPYHFVRLKDEKFFGLKEYAIESRSIKISDLEKTIVDCLDHLEYAGGITEIVKGLKIKKGEIELERLVDYAVKINNGAVVKRLDFLLHHLDYNIPENLKCRLKNNHTNSYSLLDDTRPKTGNHKEKWKLRINIDLKDLEEEIY